MSQASNSMLKNVKLLAYGTVERRGHTSCSVEVEDISEFVLAEIKSIIEFQLPVNNGSGSLHTVPVVLHLELSLHFCGIWAKTDEAELGHGASIGSRREEIIVNVNRLVCWKSCFDGIHLRLNITALFTN